MKNDLYKVVADRIIAELENGTAPWVKPWSSRHVVGGNMPCNATSNRRYSGVNVVILWSVTEAFGWPTMRFLTYKQAQDVGGNVRKGEKGTTIYFLNRFVKKDEETGKEKTIGFLKAFTVFNVAQCENLPEKVTGVVEAVETPKEHIQKIWEAEAFVKATGATIVHGGDRACYIPALDIIQMPTLDSFKSVDHYHSTEFHELGHWTGDKKRCDRDLSGRFGTGNYAAEELVAELTAAFLCAEFGLDGDLRHAGYIKNWIELLKDHPRAMFTAASKASEAADYLRGLALGESSIQEAA